VPNTRGPPTYKRQGKAIKRCKIMVVTAGSGKQSYYLRGARKIPSMSKRAIAYVTRC